MLAEGIGDAECVRRVQRGDTDSFEVLVRRHEKAIFNLVYRLLGNYDEAAEVAQEVFLSAFKSIHQFRGEANFSTWLYRIGLNHASTRRKSLEQHTTAPPSLGRHGGYRRQRRRSRKECGTQRNPTAGSASAQQPGPGRRAHYSTPGPSGRAL